MSTIMRRRRTSRLNLSVYKRHELLTGEIKIVVSGYDGYGDGRSTELHKFISDEMRLDWQTNRAMLMEFWRSGQSSTIFADCLPWLFMHGGADTLPWAAVQFDKE
jgi:hypothetical protein